MQRLTPSVSGGCPFVQLWSAFSRRMSKEVLTSNSARLFSTNSNPLTRHEVFARQTNWCHCRKVESGCFVAQPSCETDSRRWPQHRRYPRHEKRHLHQSVCLCLGRFRVVEGNKEEMKNDTCVGDRNLLNGGHQFESLAKKVVDNTRQVEIKVLSLPLQSIVDLCEELINRGFGADKVVSLLSRRFWLMENADVALALVDLMLSNGLKAVAVEKVLTNIPPEYVADDDDDNLLTARADRLQAVSFQQLPKALRGSLLNFRELGFSEASMNALLTRDPGALFSSPQVVNSAFASLQGLFSKADVFDVIKKCPNVLSDPWEETVRKFEYVFHAMGYYSQDPIVKSRCLSHSLHHITCRHLFLSRSGLFVQVRQKDDPSLNPNPPLKDVVDSPVRQFVRLVGVGVDEYETFVEMRKVEDEFSNFLEGEDEEQNDNSSEHIGDVRRDKTKKS